MYQTSTSFKDEIKKHSRSFESRVTIGNVALNNEDIVEIKLDGNIQPSDGFSIGNVTSQVLDLTIFNKGQTIYTVNQVKVEIGLKIGNTIEYIPMGLYNIDDTEKTEHTIKYTCYDNMIKFETPYFSNLGDTPTLQQVCDEIAKITGVQFTGGLPNYTVKKLDGLTCREVLGYIASICGGNATITRDGKFTIVYATDCGIKLTGDNYFDYKREEVNYKISKITCENAEKSTVSQGAIGTDSMELTFENPWVTTSILNDIYTKLNGFQYLGYKLKWQGDISLDLGDIITVTDIKGVVRKLPILSQKFTYVGGLTCELEAKGENKNKNSFSSNGNMNKKVNRVVYEQALINEALIGKANIDDLVAKNIKVDLVEGKTAILQNVITNFITGDSGQFLNLTGDNVVIADATIKSAMIDHITVDQIEAGDISTNNFRIVSDNGNMLIADNTIQIKDSNKVVRVQIGKDASSDYNMYVWDSTGKLMFDATGLKADGIKEKIIRNEMISDTANIDGKKINISSLISEVNKDTNTQLLKASKVQLDTEGQSLEISFKTLKTNVDNISVGGRNLIANSAPNDITNWGSAGVAHTKEIVTETTAPSQSAMKVTYTVAGLGGVFKPPIKDLTVGKEYSWSIYLKASKSLNVNVGNERGGCKICNVTSTWQKFTYTFTAKESQYGAFIIYAQNASIGDILYVHSVKMEEGNKPTDWTPAPEEIDSRMGLNETAIKTINGNIDTIIKNTTVTKDGATIQLKDAYSSLDQTVSGINTAVKNIKTDVVDPALLSQNLILHFNSIVNGIFNGNTFTKNKGINNSWDTGFSSVNTFSNNESVSCTIKQLGQYVMFGLSSTNADANYTSIQFAMYQTSDNQLGIYESGIKKYMVPNLTLSLNDVLMISITDDNKILYFHNGNLVYTSTVTPTLPLVLDASVYTLKGTISNIQKHSLLGGITTRMNYAETKLTDSAFTIQINRNSSKVYKVRYIRDWLAGSTVNTGNHWVEIHAINNVGVNLAQGKTVTATGGTGSNLTRITDGVYSNPDLWASVSGTAATNAVVVDLGAVYQNIDTIKVWHYYADSRTYYNTKTEISEDGTNWTALFDSAVSGTYVETKYGHSVQLNNTSLNSNLVTVNELGAEIRGGALTVINVAGDKALYTKDGQLILNGAFQQFSPSTGYKAVEIFNNQIFFYDWEKEDELNGIIYSTHATKNNKTFTGIALGSNYSDQLFLGYRGEANTWYNPFVIDPTGSYHPDITTLSQTIGIDSRAKLNFRRTDTNWSGCAFTSSDGDFIIAANYFNALKFSYEENGSYTTFVSMNRNVNTSNWTSNPYVDFYEPVALYHGLVTYGSKNRVVKTKNYGCVKQNAYETAACYFGDLMECKTDENGYCYIYFEPVFLETVNTKCKYHVFCSAYGGDDKNIEWVKCISREEDYFILKGSPNTIVSVEVKCKQLDYETDRLERLDHERKIESPTFELEKEVGNQIEEERIQNIEILEKEVKVNIFELLNEVKEN